MKPEAEFGVTSLARSALGGVVWNFSGSGVLVVAQIASTAATARLVDPREFGIYATAQGAAGFAGYFTMNAVGSGLQRRSQLGEKTVGTAMSISLAGSLVLGLALFLGASSWARAWGVPDAAPIVRVVALTLFLTAAATVPIALIRQQLRFGTAAIVETGTQVLGLAASVALAVELHSALALAVGQTVTAATLLVAAAMIVRDELRLSFDRDDARELSTFAGQVGILGFGSYLGNAAPSWFAARAFGASALGLYSRANLIVVLPLTYAATSIVKVLYPLYGRVRNDIGRTKALLDEALTLTTGLAWPAFALVAGSSPVIVEALLGPRWHAAAPLLALSAIMGCGALPAGLLTNAAEAFGWMRLIGARQLVLTAGTAATLITVHAADLGLRWLVAGIAASQCVTYVLTVAPFVKRGLLDRRSIVRPQGIHAGVSLAAYGLAVAAVWATGGTPVGIQLLAVTGVAFAVWVILFIFRAWYPAGQVLERRLSQIAGDGSGSPLRGLRTAPR